MDDKIIPHLVARFLSWKLPPDFHPDAGISFVPDYNNGTPQGGRHEPTGTNLLNAEQAFAMVRHLLDHPAFSAALSALPRAEAADEAALADLALDYLSVAQPEFCSARCPSVGREGVPIPHLSECESMRSLLTARVDSAKDAPRWKPIADPGAIVSTELLGKLTKLANYLTELGEYEAVDLIDTVVARLAAQAGER